MFIRKRQQNDEPRFNRKTIKALKEAKRMDKHPSKYIRFVIVEELMEDLRKLILNN